MTVVVSLQVKTIVAILSPFSLLVEPIVNSNNFSISNHTVAVVSDFSDVAVIMSGVGSARVSVVVLIKSSTSFVCDWSYGTVLSENVITMSSLLSRFVLNSIVSLKPPTGISTSFILSVSPCHICNSALLRLNVNSAIGTSTEKDALLVRSPDFPLICTL